MGFPIIISYAKNRNIKTIVIQDNYSLETIKYIKKITPKNIRIIFWKKNM